jgi:anionic cell wall polymer biosynthesis LytR-Cps2A-Psr (LCP) family protein
MTDWRGLGNYIPEQELDVTLLFMMSDEQGSVPNNFMLLNYRPKDEVIVIVPLNSQTRLSAGGISGRLTDLYSGGGSTRLIEAIEETLGIECEFYVQFDRSSFANFISALGDVAVNVPFPFEGGGIKLPPGEQSLSGGDLFVYMNYANYPEIAVGEDYDLVIMASAMTTLINSNCRNLDTETIQDAFNKIRNNATTNLTFRDYTEYQRALLYTSSNSINPAINYIPSGFYEGDGFVLSNQSIADILNRFRLVGLSPR